MAWYSINLIATCTSFAFNRAAEARLLIGCPVVLLSAHDLLLIGVLHLLRVREVLHLRHLRVPINWNLDLRLLRSDLHGWCHDLDGERDDLSFTKLVPTIVLDEELEDVVDADQLAMERSRHLWYQRVKIFPQILGSILVEILFLAWNLDREDLIDRFPCSTAFKFNINNVSDLFTDPLYVGISFVASN